MESHVRSSNHHTLPHKAIYFRQLFPLRIYNFRRYFETLECENKKKGGLMAFATSEYG